MRHPDRKIRSVAEMITALKTQIDRNGPIWFRGHSKKDWKLVPSLARERKFLVAESALIKRFMQNATPHLQGQRMEEWEWLFLMQHHRAQTRLLDWSESPLVALYFAVHSPGRLRTDGAVWCLDPIALNKAANIKFDFGEEIPSFGKDQVLDSYLPSRTQQNPSKLLPVAIIGPRNTPRMAAQQGTFTINQTVHTPIEKIADRKHVWRWVIPSGAKKGIIKELKHLGFTTLTLLPELDKVADLTRELLDEI